MKRRMFAKAIEVLAAIEMAPHDDKTWESSTGSTPSISNRRESLKDLKLVDGEFGFVSP